MIFYMDVTEQGVNIQHRKYQGKEASSECTEAMLIAENYYTQKAKHVEIVMTDENNIILARIEVTP